MKYLVHLDEFEGPLDLLLHLIKKSDIEIIDIDIVDITNQYMDYIYEMEKLNIDIASSYLVMAATLMEMKSISLLPNRSDEPQEEGEEEIISKEMLIEKLTNYEKYKELTKNFKKLEQLRMDIYTKSPSKFSDLGTVNSYDKEANIEDLVISFQKFLERKEMEKPILTKVVNHEYSVKKRKKKIFDILKNKGRIEFHELFDIYNKSYIVVTFLSVLELTREENIKLIQNENFANIYIELEVR